MELSKFGYLPGWREGTTTADRDLPAADLPLVNEHQKTPVSSIIVGRAFTGPIVSQSSTRSTSRLPPPRSRRADDADSEFDDCSPGP
jgi:hypothetical protein